MRRLLFIAITGCVSLLAVAPWMVIHVCGGEASVDFFAGSAKDPCGCDDANPSDRCCTLVVKSFQFDNAKPVTPVLHSASLGAVRIATIPSAVALPDPAVSSSVNPGFRPPGTPPLPLLHCTLLI